MPNLPPYSTDGIIKPKTAAANITPAAKDKIISENQKCVNGADVDITHIFLQDSVREMINLYKEHKIKI